MTWREYQLRRMGYIRTQKEEWKRTRLISYHSLVATGAVDPKKMSIEQFMPLDDERKPKATSEGLKALALAREKYNQEVNGSRT